MKKKIMWGVIIIMGLALLGAGGWLYYQTHRVRLHVCLFQGDRETDVMTAGKTVGEVVREMNIPLKTQDVVVPPLSAAVTEGLEIDLGLVERRVKDFKKKSHYNTHTDYADNLNVGEIIDIQQGKDGMAQLETEDFYLNGEEAFEKVLKSKVLIPTKDAKVLEGTALNQKLYTLKKRARVSKTLTMQATAYYPGPEDTWPYASGYTASGLKAGYGVAAVDPRYIRLKTQLYIVGYGYAIAADKGGAIKGNKIDLCFDTYEEAVRFGKKNVTVYILR